MSMKKTLAIVLATAGMVLLSWALAADAPAGGADDDYPHGEWSDDCALCHDEGRYVPLKPKPGFRHEKTGFPLEGAHRTTPCRACHTVLDFSKVSRECATCHRDPHVGEFGADCARCHVPRSFIDRSAQLDRHRASRFPLTGAHVSVDCDRCHPGRPQGQATFVHAPTECYACHRADYESAADPDHKGLGFPTDCAFCHTPTAWERARFDHSQTGFPLTGAHRSQACSACHPGGRYSGTPTDCYACHKDRYDNANNPNHKGAGFPTNCLLCHNTTDFEGARFTQHDALYFPIYSGRHAGAWAGCTDCHTNPTSYAQFSCFLCHGQAETTAKHSGVPGFSYNSNACYACHPRGVAEDR